jgi:hypothetical protein
MQVSKWSKVKEEELTEWKTCARSSTSIGGLCQSGSDSDVGSRSEAIVVYPRAGWV